MGSLIALISICLNIVAFYWILILTQRFKGLEAKASQFDQKELETQLGAYLDAVREENANLLKEVGGKLKQSAFTENLTRVRKQDVETEPRRPYSPEQLAEDYETNLPLDFAFQDLVDNQDFLKKDSVDQGVESFPKAPEDVIDSLETSTLARILQLKQEGHNTEKIAKELGMGKGEVALMLKLHEKR